MKTSETLMKWVFLLAAAASVLAVALICIFLLEGGMPAMAEIGVREFLLGTVWKPGNNLYGILPMILGSLCVTAGAVLLGVPVGLLAAVYMACFCPKKFYKIFSPCVQLLAGIPSVVYGFFAMVVIVPFVREHLGGSGNSMLTASVLLGMMILPTMIMQSEAAIRAVSTTYYRARWRWVPHRNAAYSVSFCLQPGRAFWRVSYWASAVPLARPWLSLWSPAISLVCPRVCWRVSVQ